MPAQWTVDLVGQMHKHKITKSQLADELGMSREYVSMVINGISDKTTSTPIKNTSSKLEGLDTNARSR